MKKKEGITIQKITNMGGSVSSAYHYVDTLRLTSDVNENKIKYARVLQKYHIEQLKEMFYFSSSSISINIENTSSEDVYIKLFDTESQKQCVGGDLFIGESVRVSSVINGVSYSNMLGDIKLSPVEIVHMYLQSLSSKNGQILETLTYINDGVQSTIIPLYDPFQNQNNVIGITSKIILKEGNFIGYNIRGNDAIRFMLFIERGKNPTVKFWNMLKACFNILYFSARLYSLTRLKSKKNRV